MRTIKKLPYSFFQQIVLAIGMLWLLPACLSRYQGQVVSNASGKLAPFVDEAKLTDVPLPLRVVSYSLESLDPENTMITFTSLHARSDLLVFYQLEMERLGWKQVSMVQSSLEVLLLYEKPRKVCAISMRPHQQVFVTVGMKKR